LIAQKIISFFYTKIFGFFTEKYFLEKIGVKKNKKWCKKKGVKKLV